jgi:hypothetical protein
VFKATLEAKEGFKFDVYVTNVKGLAGFTSIGGKGSKDFSDKYMFEPGHELCFIIDEHAPITKVMSKTYPIIHPCMFAIYFLFFFSVLICPRSSTPSIFQ